MVVDIQGIRAAGILETAAVVEIVVELWNFYYFVNLLFIGNISSALIALSQYHKIDWFNYCTPKLKNVMFDPNNESKFKGNGTLKNRRVI